MQTHLSKSGLVLLFLFSFSLICHVFVTAYCPPGYYYFVNHDHEEGCNDCPRGFYCPGGDVSPLIPCPAGSFTSASNQAKCTACQGVTDQRHTSCLPCPNGNRKNAEKTICLLPDTPINSRQVYNVFNLTQDVSYFYQELDAEIYGLSMQITFKVPEDENIIVYASRKTGQPSKDDYEFTGFGKNLTIAIPNEKQTRMIVYYAISFLEPRKESFVVVPSLQFTTPILSIVNLKKGLNTAVVNLVYDGEILFKFDTGKEQDFENGVEFEIIESKTNPFSVYYSAIPQVYYPNPNNANVIVRSNPSGHAVLRVAHNPKAGSIIFAVHLQGFYGDAKVLVNVKAIQ